MKDYKKKDCIEQLKLINSTYYEKKLIKFKEEQYNI